MNRATRRDFLHAVGARHSWRSTRPHNRISDRPGASALENLESRVLMSAFTYADLADRFNFPDHLHDIQQPGAEYVGFGHAATVLGDVDNDGFSDFAISAPGSAFGAEEPVAGAIFIFSGQDGTLLRTLTDGAAGFGASLANVGDLNADGINDLLIGSPQFDDDGDQVAHQFGRAWIYSGADGSEIRTIDGAGDADEFGYAVTALGDVNDDSINDFAIGAPGAGLARQGQVTVFSGADGAVIHSFTGESTGNRFGAALFGADVGTAYNQPGDGIGDILVGAPGGESAGGYAGSAYLYDGFDGSLRWSVDGVNGGDHFGTSVAFLYAPSAPNNSSENTIYIGAPDYDSVYGENTGKVFRYNEMGQLRDNPNAWLGTVPDGRYGASVTLIGDLTSDRASEVAVTSPGADGFTRVIIYWGGDTQFRQFVLSPTQQQWIGDNLFALGDIDNDGFDDIGSAFFSEGRLNAVSSLPFLPLAPIALASDNLDYIFSMQYPFSFPYGPARDFAIINDHVVALSKVPGLVANDQLLGVNNEGDMVVQNDSEGSRSFYIIRDGTRTLLQDLLQGVPTNPAPNFDRFAFVAMSNTGEVLFTDTADIPNDERDTTRSWLLTGTTLSFIFEGEVRDINDSGQILGVRHTDEGNVVVLISADGFDETVIDLLDAQRLSNTGIVVGVNAARNLAMWQDGEITEIAVQPVLNPPHGTPFWLVRGVTDDGVVQAAFSIPFPGPVPNHIEYLYDPEDGLTVITDNTFDIDYGEDPYASMVMITPDGTILQQHGFFTRVADDAPWIGMDGVPISAYATSDSLVAAGVNQFGDAVAMRLIDGEWRGWLINTAYAANDPLYTTINEVLAFTDSAGMTSFFVMTDNYTLFAQQDIEQSEQIFASVLGYNRESWTRMTSSYTVFESADGRVHLAGVDQNGDLILYYENAPTATEWYYDNITDVHINGRDATFHPVESNLTSLITDWDATHLFYLDQTGALYSIWIGRGMTYWESTNISQHLDRGNIADDPSLALHGDITAYGTPWGGLNVAGASVDGDPTAIWWVPGEAGTWHYNKIYGYATQPEVTFNPASVTSYTAPWGSLHLASIQESGEIAVYWWGPGALEWSAEILNITDRPDGLTFEGDITSAVMGETLNLFARGNDGEYYRMFWNEGDGGMWNIENITESVA